MDVTPGVNLCIMSGLGLRKLQVLHFCTQYTYCAFSQNKLSFLSEHEHIYISATKRFLHNFQWQVLVYLNHSYPFYWNGQRGPHAYPAWYNTCNFHISEAVRTSKLCHGQMCISFCNMFHYETTHCFHFTTKEMLDLKHVSLLSAYTPWIHSIHGGLCELQHERTQTKLKTSLSLITANSY